MLKAENISKPFWYNPSKAHKNNNQSFLQKGALLSCTNLKLNEVESLIIIIPFRCGKSILLNLSASLENLCSSYWILASWEKYKAGREQSVFFQRDNALLPWFTLQNKSQKRSETTGILEGSRTSMGFHFVNMERFPSFEVLYIYQLFPSKKKQKVVATTIAFMLNLGILQMEESIVHLEIQTRKCCNFN